MKVASTVLRRGFHREVELLSDYIQVYKKGEKVAISSIHIQRSVAGSVGHNSREHFSYSVVFSDEENECSTQIDEANKTYRSELKIRTKAYTDRIGQKLQKRAVTQLSAIVNLEAYHTLEDLELIKAELERLFDTKVYQMAMHRDEGKLVSKEDETELYSGKDFFLNPGDKKLFFDKKFTKPVPMENYQIIKNYHGHIEMMGLDSKGNAIRQKMNKLVLQQLQTTTAEKLGMERGKTRNNYSKEEMTQIVAIVGSKSDYENVRLYAQKFNEIAKDLGIFKDPSDKRKDTHKFKDDGAEQESGKRNVLATQKDLNLEMAQLRAQLEEQGAGRADYAQLEQINKELKEQIKVKELRNDQLTKSLERVQSLLSYAKSKNVDLEITNSKQSSNYEILNESRRENSKSVSNFAREIGIIPISNKETFSPKILMPEIKKEFERLKKQLIIEAEHAKAENDLVKLERDRLIADAQANKSSMKDVETSLRVAISDLEERLLNAPKQELVDELRAQNEILSKELDRSDKLLGTIDGYIESGASNELLKGLAESQKSYRPTRAGYVTAKECAQTAYPEKLGGSTPSVFAPVVVQEQKLELDFLLKIVKSEEEEQTQTIRPGG